MSSNLDFSFDCGRVCFGADVDSRSGRHWRSDTCGVVNDDDTKRIQFSKQSGAGGSLNNRNNNIDWTFDSCLKNNKSF